MFATTTNLVTKCAYHGHVEIILGWVEAHQTVHQVLKQHLSKKTKQTNVQIVNVQQT